MSTNKIACVTGGARRIGRAIVLALHGAGFDVIIHYQTSEADAQSLAQYCNQQRAHSAHIVQGQLDDVDDIEMLANAIIGCAGRLDVLIHNASRFYPTPMGEIQAQDWHNLIDSNAKAPLFLTQALLPYLQMVNGNVISILDIHADNRPFLGYSVYNMAKAAHRMLVQSLALELAPNVRVNAVAPGVNILPEAETEQALTEAQIREICQSVPLQRIGTPEDIAQTVLFLATAPYITGQTIAVDGGRSLTLAGVFEQAIRNTLSMLKNKRPVGRLFFIYF